MQALTYTVTNTNDSGTGSLRDAINSVNTSTDAANEIAFNIPGPGPFRMQLSSPLPAINNQVTIDGYTQPGASVNTLAQGTNARLLIEINGNNYSFIDSSGGSNGLLIGGNGSVIRGLVINEWLTSAIYAYGNQVSINGNFIGTDVNGIAVMACQIGILNEGQFTQIGTSNYADRNLLAGSFNFFAFGSCISSFESTQVTIQGNLIGTDRTGTSALGNSCYGIISEADTNALIGGLGPNEGNVISGQSIYGAWLYGSTNATVQGNLIGTDVTGTQALGNSNAGLFTLYASSFISNNLISGNGNGGLSGRLSRQMDLMFFKAI